MQDYSKLTVAKLKEELDKRGLPKAGLKAALVQRLEEADKEAQVEQPDTEQLVQNNKDVNSQIDQVALVANAFPEPEEISPAQHETVNEGETVFKATNGNAATRTENEQTKEVAATQEQMGHEEPAAPASEGEEDVLPGTITHQSTFNECVTEKQLPTPVQTQPESSNMILPTSTQTSVAPEELAEDSRKRKRRSQTPPPSSVDTSKRLRSEIMSNGRPDVRLPEDLTSQNTPREADSEALVGGSQLNGRGELAEPEETSQSGATGAEQNGHASQNEVIASPTYKRPSRSRSRSRTPPASNRSDQHQKAPTSDRRFHSLTAPSSKAKSPPSSQPDTVDRDIPPSVHPATSAIYIRNLMRPLNPSSLKAHLTSLANSTSTTSSSPANEEEVITTFHIDAIRTHALVNFTSTSSASRVRANLHDRVWPNERDRKTLWIDFVPEEKLQTWIEVESSRAGGGSREGNKRWEVIYETEEDGVRAYLQEVRSAAQPGPQAPPSQPQRPFAAANPSSGSNAEPKVKRVEAESKEFKALDDLFLSTMTAKPKLYYLPATKPIAERRLEVLAQGKGGGRGGDEMRRFSFNDEGRIVDKGPEFGWKRGGRGGGRGGRVTEREERGGYSGYRARGTGGYGRGGDRWGGRGY
ncbi:uncharacterized protein KY384_000558 [Bacidia gigantensis]|uniref:uncharacterized protein n=1 Tax=Bacidia gigantensis TaxID=2732470 RepID=UPI001D0461AE|nr:uncharacterized protein KY384_000558 [Bacidia gigantensis]KAG8525798.1 hypothetical protein KY384_000558 [Bacidia gigantensis]